MLPILSIFILQRDPFYHVRIDVYCKGICEKRVSGSIIISCCERSYSLVKPKTITKLPFWHVYHSTFVYLWVALQSGTSGDSSKWYRSNYLAHGLIMMTHHVYRLLNVESLCNLA